MSAGIVTTVCGDCRLTCVHAGTGVRSVRRNRMADHEAVSPRSGSLNATFTSSERVRSTLAGIEIVGAFGALLTGRSATVCAQRGFVAAV